MTKVIVGRDFVLSEWFYDFLYSNRNEYEALDLDEMKKLVSHWNGRYCWEDGNYWMEFENDADATAFLLRWS